jgi:hypothetical protein
VRAQLGERGLQDVPLGDAAQVEPHAGGGEAHAAGVGVEREPAPADAGAGGVERGSLGERAPAARLAPEGDQRAHGGIEGAIARARDVDRAGEHGEQRRAHRDPRARPALEAAQLARGAPVAHHVLERGDAGEGGTGRPARAAVVGRVEHDARGHAHVHLGELAAHRRGRLRGERPRGPGRGEDHHHDHGRGAAHR